MADLRANALGGNGQTSTVSSLSIVVPAEAVDGDIAILEVESSNDTVTLTTPAGWTLIYGPDRVGTTASGWLFRKTIASGDAGGPVSLVFSTSQRCQARMSVYSGVSATGVLTARRIESTAATSTTLPSLGSVPEGALLHVAWLRRFGGTPAPNVTAPAGYSQGASARTSTSFGSVPELSIEAAYRVVPSAGTYGGETASVSSNSVGVNYVIALRGIVSDVTVAGVVASATASTAEGAVSNGGTTVEGTPARATAAGLSGDITGTTIVPVEQPEQWPPELYRQAIRNGLAIYYTVDASIDGVDIAGATDLRPVEGSITDTNRPGVRRTGSMTFADSSGELYKKLTPSGVRLTVTAHLRYTGRTELEIPMGVFVVDTDRLSERSGQLSVTAPDKWIHVQRAKFIHPQNSNRGDRVVDQIATLIRGALGQSEAVIISATSQAIVGQLTWEEDREEAINTLAAEIGAWVYFDRDGVATIADIPRAGATAKWLIDASASGVLTDIDREQSTADAANVVVVESTASDEEKFPTVVVFDSDPLSPTYAGPDPVNQPDQAGPWGLSVVHVSSPNLQTAVEAAEFGGAELARSTGLASQVSLEEVPNPALDAFDVIDVLPPGQEPNGVTGIDGFGLGGFGESAFGEASVFEATYRSTRDIERHIADTVTHPMTVGPAQRIDARSVRITGLPDVPLPDVPDPVPDPEPEPDPGTPTITTIFGYNTNEGDTVNQTLAGRQAWWGRAPMVRRYNSSFVPATWPVSAAVYPEGRISYSFKADGAGSFTIAGLAAGNGNARFRSFIESIPAGKTVYLTYYHEVNDDIREGRITPAQFKATYGHLYGQLQAARAANSLAAGTTVKLCANFMAYRLTDMPTYFDDSWVPSASQMDLLTFDIYGNPGELGASSIGTNTYGTATGPGYGTRYPLPSVRAQPMFDIIRRLGWAQKWGILEVNTPARSWDTNEASRARWLKDMYDLFLAQPYKPEVVLLWEAPSGVNWDQSFGRVAGSPNASVNALAPYIKGSP